MIPAIPQKDKNRWVGFIRASLLSLKHLLISTYMNKTQLLHFLFAVPGI